MPRECQAIVRSEHAGGECLGAAVASSPTGPFTPVGSGPLVCTPELGGSIDASSFTDTDGKHYLLYKTDGNANGIIDAEPFARRMYVADLKWAMQIPIGPRLLTGAPKRPASSHPMLRRSFPFVRLYVLVAHRPSASSEGHGEETQYGWRLCLCGRLSDLWIGRCRC